MLSIQAIKGVEIGDAWDNARKTGTLAQDGIYPPNDNDTELIRKTNHAGGIEGGISNGQPIVIRAAMKPIATTLTPQASVDLTTGEVSKTRYERSDFCPVPRAVPVLESMLSYVLADALIEKIGGDSLSEMMPRFIGLRKARVVDLKMDTHAKVWWE
jgi:chorismate synthase